MIDFILLLLALVVLLWPILAAKIWEYKNRKSIIVIKNINDDFDAPRGWSPPLYLGSGKNHAFVTKTPMGIRVYASGFNGLEIPILKNGVHARVSLSMIDKLWMRARINLCGKNSPSSLTKEEKIIIANMPDDFPIVMIEPTIWWSRDKKRFTDRDSLYGDFLGGKELVVMVAVWYKTKLKSPCKIISWVNILEEEFQNAILIYLGKGDAKLAKR